MARLVLGMLFPPLKSPLQAREQPAERHTHTSRPPTSAGAIASPRKIQPLPRTPGTFASFEFSDSSLMRLPLAKFFRASRAIAAIAAIVSGENTVCIVLTLNSVEPADGRPLLIYRLRFGTKQARAKFFLACMPRNFARAG